jgi:internalin A
MERFDLSYRTLENREVSLVVERLPLEVPDYRKSWDSPLREKNSRELAMIFRLSAVPAGIPTWFIARQHRFTTYTHWRTGALFADLGRAHKALIHVDPHKRIAELRTRGPYPHDFFALLKDGFELTLGRFPGLNVRRLVPCPGHGGASCVHQFDYAHLLAAIDRQPPVMEIQCPVSFENISVPGLLFGIHWHVNDIVIEKIDAARNELMAEVGETKLQLEHVSSGLDANVRLMQREFLKLFKREQAMVETRCPNVFTITPVAAGWKKVIGQRAELQLYCQAPGSWHPTTEGGRYEFTVEASWLRRALPYILELVKILQYAAPLVGPVIGVVNAGFEKSADYDIKLMEKFVAALPSEFRVIATRTTAVQTTSGPKQLEGSSLRAFRALLESLDKLQDWGRLQPKLTPEGHLLWLCEDHTLVDERLLQRLLG